MNQNGNSEFSILNSKLGTAAAGFLPGDPMRKVHRPGGFVPSLRCLLAHLERGEWFYVGNVLHRPDYLETVSLVGLATWIDANFLRFAVSAKSSSRQRSQNPLSSQRKAKAAGTEPGAPSVAEGSFL